MSGRSPWYGASILWLQSAIGGFSIVAFQSALMSAAVLLAARHFIGKDYRALLIVGLGVALLTPAPFFTSYVMPDYLAGIGALAILVLVFNAGRARYLEWVFWCAVLGLSVLSHSSHLLFAFGLLFSVLLLQIVLRQPFHRATGGAIFGILTGAVLVAQIQSALLADRYGAPAFKPPFLSARLIDDGPGYRYLAENCPQIQFTLCQHIDRLPVASDWFLWDKRSEIGVYQLASPADRRSMGDEQFRFARAVISQYPLAQAGASLGNLVEQLGRFSLREFHYNAEMRGRIMKRFAGERLMAQHDSRLYQGEFPLEAISTIQLLMIIAAFQGSIFVLMRGGVPIQLFFLAAGVVLVLIGNAAITGMLSTPHDRYQARVIWIVGFLALILWQDRRSRQSIRCRDTPPQSNLRLAHCD